LEVSPEVGRLDESALDAAMDEDPDQAMALLADLAGATDEALRRQAQRLAARIVIDFGRLGPANRRGFARLRRVKFEPDGGDLDLDASVVPLAIARAGGPIPDPEELRTRGWERPATSLCLLVDRSGSMAGAPLATAAVAAAAVASRAPDDYSVVAFSYDAIVAKSQDTPRPVERVVTDLLTLRGHGTTDLALALRTAGEQLGRSRAGRRVTILLSDCRATAGDDPVVEAASLTELWIVAPAGDSEAAEELARAVGARCATVAGPSSVPAALARLVDPQS
jgi:Mg-chelatase subunit ChlD